MATAIDVANYFLNKVDREAGDLITQLKLQKLVYYAQAWSLALRGQCIFDETIEAWINGPVVPSLWTEFREYGKNPIPQPKGEDTCSLNSEEIKLLDYLWGIYGELSASKLWKLSHKENPWKVARGGIPSDQSSSNPIPKNIIKDYYSNFIDIENCKIHPEALSELKHPGSLITLHSEENSGFLQIRLSEMSRFLEKTCGDRKKQVSRRRPLVS